MKSFLQIIKATITGGLLFLVPLVLLFIVADKAFKLSQKIITPIIKRLPGTSIALQEIFAVILILAVCFIAGLIANKKNAKKLVGKIENGILSHVPGYMFIKKIGEGMVGIEDTEELKVVLVKVDDAWQLAFMIEQIDENLFTVFVPDAPSPWSGSVYHIEKDRMRFTDITQKEAMNCLRKLGYGSANFLKGKL